MTEKKVRFVPGDAPLLIAATHHWRPSRARKLWEFLDAIDYLYRDVPSFDDVSFGFARLVAGGYIRVRKSPISAITVTATQEGLRLGSLADKGSRNILDLNANMSRLLGCKPWPETEAEDRSRGRLKGMSEAEWNAAVAEYHAHMDLRQADRLGKLLQRLFRSVKPADFPD